MEPLIRRARPSDARAIARVHSHSWQHAYRGLLSARYLASLSVDEITPVWRHRLRSAPAGLDPWLALLDETVVGFCLAHPHRDERELNGWAGEISYLYVHPSLTGRGIGSALLEHALHELAKRELRWVVISVLEANGRARRFYRRRGLRPDGARWIDRRFGVPVLRYAASLNPVVDFDALRAEAAARR